MSDSFDASSNPRLTVACLCAEWCGTCRDYRNVFDQAVQSLHGDGIDGRWIDVEDEADLMGEVDVENFPTLLIARGADVLFFGTVTPHASTLTRLMRAALAGQSHLGGDAPDADVRALATRL